MTDTHPKKDKLIKDQPQEMPSEGGPLADYHGKPPEAPEWFRDAVAQRYEKDFVDVDGAQIHYQSWSEPSKPGLLLVHGNGAHAHWWDL